MQYIPAKNILSAKHKNNPWFGVHYTMNLYKGCCHGCIYCDSRSDCYGIEDFDTVRAKADALPTLERELKAKRDTAIVATGAMSDPYQPFEQDLQLTRGALSLLDRYGFGTAIATKSDGILRDIDILQSISSHSPVLCKLTITTCDDTLCKKVEPHVAVSSRRFAVIKELSQAGLFTGILCMPVLPYLEDTEENILDIVEQAAEAGAKFIYPALGMTLRGNQRDWYYRQLEEIFPGKGLRRKYQDTFAGSYECPIPQVRYLFQKFSSACRAHKILYRMSDIISAYQNQSAGTQLRLF